MKKVVNWICMALIFILLGCHSHQSVRAEKAGSKYTPDWESLKNHEPAPEWFRDAKFGIYFHWGVYSVPAFGSEWYPRNMYNKSGQARRPGPSSECRHHTETWGDPGEFGYPDFVPMFKAEKFDADQWAELFVKAGAKFAGPVAEHHDGYAMWDSELTTWNAADTGPKRDITGELAEAIKSRGMKFVTTFHHARNNLWQKKTEAATLNGQATISLFKEIFRLCLKILRMQFFTVICRGKSSWIYGKGN